MAVIEYGLAGYLAASATVTPIISGRIYPTPLPLHVTLPACTYRQITGAPDYSHSGPSGLVNSMYQIDCWGATMLAARGLAEAVKTDLSGYRGTFTTPDGPVSVGSVFLRGEMVVPEPDSETVHIALTFAITSQH